MELSPVPSKPRPAGKRWVWSLLALFGLGYCGFGGVVWLLGDRMWLGTVLLFSPRHLLAWPLVTLLVVLPCCRRRQGALAVAVMVFGLLQVSRFCLPWGMAWLPGTATGQEIRVLTFNAARFPDGPARFEQLVAAIDPDVVFLQEVHGGEAVTWPVGWTVLKDGELLIASRFPLTARDRVVRSLPGRWPRTISLFGTVHTPHGDVPVGVTHLLSPRQGLSGIVNSQTILDLSKRRQIDDEIQWRRSESSRVADAVSQEKEGIILGGDLNMPDDSRIYRDHWGGLRNAFSRAGFGFGHSVFLRQGPFTFAARIDHVLFTKEWHCTRCWVGPDVGSDHRPVIADLRRRS